MFISEGTPSLQSSIEMEEPVCAMEQVILPRRWKKTRRGKKKKPFDRHQDVEKLVMTCRCMKDSEDTVMMNRGTTFDNDTAQSQDKPKGFSKLVRPFNSPRAPHNSTQFIIDDRLGSACRPILDSPLKNPVSPVMPSAGGLYEDFYNGVDMSVTVSEQCLSPDGHRITSLPEFTWKTSPAFSDVDYKYKAYPVEDFLTFQQQDFEQEFQHVREKALHQRSKSELISDITDLKCTIQSLQSQFKCMSNAQRKQEMSQKHLTIDDNTEFELESKLAVLQQKNQTLKAENLSLQFASS